MGGKEENAFSAFWFTMPAFELFLKYGLELWGSFTYERWFFLRVSAVRERMRCI